MSTDKSDAITVRLPVEVINQLDQLKARSQFPITRTSIIRKLLIEALKDYRFSNEHEAVGKDK
jgi:hypothetical protein